MSDIKKIILDTPTQELENIISPFIQEQFPSFIRADHHKLILFIKSYYEWLEQKDNPGYVLAKLDTVGDIDNNAEEFYSHFKNTYMDSFPEIMAINTKGESPNKMTLLKKISEFYKNKGTESAYKFLFRLLYDSDLEIYYPKEDILRVSSGVWTEPRSVKTTSSSSRDIFKTVNGTLTQYDPADSSIIIASAFIDDVVRYSSNGIPITEFFLRQISGVFLPNIAVTAMSGTTSYTERTYSVLGEFFIETAGTGYTVGDTLFISSSGTGFAAKVSVTGLAGSIKRISIENSGVNYFTEVEAIVISSVGGNTATRIVLKPTAITNYPGYFSGNKGKISSNKKIQDGHYYQEFSYALKSSISFDKYFSVLKALTHPSGMRMFGEILQQSNLGMTPSLFSQFKILDTPIIGNYTPYRFETVLNLRANGAISSTGYTSGVGYLTWADLSGAVLGGTNQDDSSEIISTINDLARWGQVGAISTQHYLDDIEVNASAPILTSAFVGLNRNQPALFASNEAYKEIDYSWQFVAFGGNGYAAACINGEQQNINQIGGFERSADSTLPRNSTDIFTIRYEGGNINWFKNRNLILSRVAMEYVPGITLHAQVAIEPQYDNNKVQNLSFVDRQNNIAVNGDLYPAGYNPYIPFPSVAINGISSPQGTLFVDVGLSGGYTYAVMPENGITTHNTLGNPLGSSASWRTGTEGINDQTIVGIPGKVLWLKPEGLISLSGGSAAGASLARWTDASGEENHGILPTWDRWNDTLVYGKKTENTTGWNQSLFNTNPATTIEWRVGHYGSPIQGMSFASDPSNLQVVGFWAAGCCGGLTLNGNTFADGPLGTGGNTMDGGRMRLDAAWYASTTNAGLPSIEFVELGRGVSASATAVVASIPTTYTTNTVFGLCFDETNRKVNAYIDGVVYRSQIGIPTGTTFYIDSSIYGLSANIEILKADFRGVPIASSGWTSTNGVTFTIVTGNTMEFLAPTIVKNDSAVGRDGLRFNGDLILSPHLLWLGQTGSINSIRSNPEMNFVRGNPGTEATLQGSHFYLTRGLSLAADMEAFIVCRNSSDDYYSGRWFVGSHRKFQGNTYDVVFSHTSFNAADRDISLSGSTAYYRAAIVSPITGATALAYDHNTGLVGFRPAGPNITGVQKTLAYDPHVSLSSVGTSIGEWSRAEDFTINSFFNGDSSKNISPSTGRYRSTETLPYKIEYAGFTSGHLLEIGRFGNGPIESISTLAGKNWLEEDTLTYAGDGGLTAVGLVATYSKKYKGKISYDVVVGVVGNAYLQYNSDFNSLTGSDTPSKDWTFSAYLKRDDAAAIDNVLVSLLPASGSPDSLGIGTTTPVGDGWYHVKRSIVGQTLGGLALTGVTLDLVGFYALSTGMTYTISGAVLEKHKEYAPIGSTAWAEAVSADSKYGFEGDINEILVFNRKLNEDERQTVYGYISKKYSLSDALPNSFRRSHPSAQRVGEDYWKIRHHPNTTAVVGITMYSTEDTLITPTRWQNSPLGVMPTRFQLPAGFREIYAGEADANSLVLGYSPWGALKNLWQAQNANTLMKSNTITILNEVWAATWIATDPSVQNNTLAPESLGNVNVYKYVKPMIHVFDCVGDGGWEGSSAREFIRGERGCPDRFPAITTKTQELPVGKRVLKLTRYDQGELYSESGDEYANGHPSPWAENLGTRLKDDWSEIATALHKAGCCADYIVMDSPPGEGNPFSVYAFFDNNFATNIVNDPRASDPWYGIKSFNEIYTNDGQHKLEFDEIYSRTWHPQTHTQYLRWNNAVSAIQTELLNEFIVKPTKEILGIQKASNYDAAIFREDTDIYDFNGHDILGENIMGDAASPVLYAAWGQPNNYGILASDTTRIVRTDYANTLPFPVSAWNQFLNLIQTIRGVKRASPDTPIRPWIASIDWNGDGPSSPFNPQWNTDSNSKNLYWESIKHFVLTGSDMINYWNSNDDTTQKLTNNCTKLNSILTDINERIGGYSLQQTNTSRIDYLSDYVISGVPVESGYVWRVTPNPDVVLYGSDDVLLELDSDRGAWVTTQTSTAPIYYSGTTTEVPPASGDIYQVDADFSRSMFSTHYIANNGSNIGEWNDWTDTTIATYQGTPDTGTRAYPWENNPISPETSSPWHNIIYETCIGSYNWGARAFFLYCPFGSFNQSWFLTPEIYKRTYTAADSSGTAHDQPAIWKGFKYAINALLEGTLAPVAKTAMNEPSNVMIYHPSVRGYYQYRNSSNAFWNSLPGSTDEKKDAQFYEYLDAWIDDLISMKASTSNGGRLHITLDAISPSATPSDIELWRSMPDYKTDALELSDWYIFNRLVAAGIPTFYESRSVIARNQASVPSAGSGVAGATLAVEWAGKAFTGEEYWFWYSNPTHPSTNASFSNHVSDENTSMVFRLVSANFPIPSDRDPFGLTKTATSNGKTKTFTTNDNGNAFTPQFAMSHHYMMSDHYRKFYNENTNTRTFTGTCAEVKNIIGYDPSLICGTDLTLSVYDGIADPLLKYRKLPASTVAYRPAFNSGTAPGEWNHAGGVDAYTGGYWVDSGKTAWDTNVRDATMSGFLSKLHAYSLLVGPSSQQSEWEGITYGTNEDTLTNDVIVLM